MATILEFIEKNWAEIVAFFDKIYAIVKEVLGAE